jgi:hypothetical protein
VPDWLIDPSRTTLILLAAVCLGAAAAAVFLVPAVPRESGKGKAASSRKRRLLLVVSVVAGLAFFGLLIADRLWESDREQIVRKLDEMSAGVAERNLDKVFQHVSEKFQYGSATKATLRSRGERALQQGELTEIPVWDVQVPPIKVNEGRVKVLFRFKVKGNRFTENQFLGEGIFANENGEWRLVGIEVYSPTGIRDRYQIPGL